MGKKYCFFSSPFLSFHFPLLPPSISFLSKYPVKLDFPMMLYALFCLVLSSQLAKTSFACCATKKVRATLRLWAHVFVKHWQAIFTAGASKQIKVFSMEFLSVTFVFWCGSAITVLENLFACIYLSMSNQKLNEIFLKSFNPFC